LEGNNQAGRKLLVDGQFFKPDFMDFLLLMGCLNG
jgi:hypothetical protein